MNRRNTLLALVVLLIPSCVNTRYWGHTHIVTSDKIKPQVSALTAMDSPFNKGFPSFRIKLPPFQNASNRFQQSGIYIQNGNDWEHAGDLYAESQFADGSRRYSRIAVANIYGQRQYQEIGSWTQPRTFLLQCGYKKSPPKSGEPWFHSVLKVTYNGQNRVPQAPGYLYWPPNELRIEANDSRGGKTNVSILYYAAPFTKAEWEGSDITFPM